MSTIYLVSDLFGDSVELRVGCYRDHTADAVEVIPPAFSGDEWCVVADYDVISNHLKAEPSVAELRSMLASRLRRLPEVEATPTISAKALAERIKRRIRLTPDALLADPEFARLARSAAEQGKTFSADLLAWEAKPVVQAAVAVVRQQVDAERAAEAARRAAIRADGDARRAADAPTRDAVLAAYAECGYRTCTQGHGTVVEIDGHDGRDGLTVTQATPPGVRCDTSKYSSRCTLRRTESRHTLRVKGDWLTAVAARGLETHEGKLVLDAAVTGHLSDGTPVLTILRVRQSRGTALETESVRCNAETHDEVKDAIEYRDPRILHDALIDLGREDAAAMVRI